MFDVGSPVRRPPSKGRSTPWGHAMRAFRKIVVSSLTVPLLATGALVATTEPSDAATTCKIGISGLPSKVTIDATDRRYWVRATSSNCPGLDKELSWAVGDAYGPNSMLRRTYSFIDADFDARSRLTLWSSDFKAGKYVVLDDGSSIVDHNYRDMHYRWVKKSFTAKYRGWTTMAVKRKGSYVRMSGHVRRYSPAWLDYVAFKHKVSIQRYYGGSWHTIATKTPVRGAFSFTYKTTKRSTYRAKTVATKTTLGDVSPKHTVRAR